MRWGKFVLFFQAVVTLIIGLLFFVNLLISYQANIDRFSTLHNIDVVSGSGDLEIVQAPSVEDLAKAFEFKFKTASYILVVISLMEIVIISRLV